MFQAITLITTLALLGTVPDDPVSDGERMLIRGVAVSEQFIVFAYAGDLWRVGLDGGQATRVTRGEAEDAFPVFAPDGRQIAFSRRTADDWDVYRVSPAGGEPERLTYHPGADIARGWTQDGSQVLFVSHRDAASDYRLYTIAPGAPLPVALPLPRGWDGSYASVGERIAYVPRAQPLELYDADWRHYRGGMTSRIWIAELESGEISELPGTEFNDRSPMWLGERIYFISDRSGTFNLHSFDPTTGQLEQLTEYSVYGIDFASAGAGLIAFVRDGRLHIFNSRDNTSRTVSVQVGTNSSELRSRIVTGARWVQSAAPAPGKRVVLGYRGDVVVLNVLTGESQNLTRSAGVNERHPRMSPDGNWVAYFSDQSGEYELRVRSLTDSGEVRRIPVEMRPSHYRELSWSPDSKSLAFSDKRLALWVADIETGGARRVTTSEHSLQDVFHIAWSPAGTWLAYSRYESNGIRAIYVYHVDRGRGARITGGRVNADYPIFDRGGKYLYFIASNTAGLGESGWSVLSGELFRPLITRRLQVVLLREGLPAPAFPIVGEPNPQADSIHRRFRASGERPSPGGRRAAPPPGRRGEFRGGPDENPVIIDLPSIEERIVPLPTPPRDYAALAPAPEANALHVLVREWNEGLGPSEGPARSLYRYDLSRPKQLIPVLDAVDELVVSTDGVDALYRTGQRWTLRSAGGASSTEEATLNLADIQTEVDPMAEWRQIYHEAWRLMRDYLYDPTYHGQNLQALETHYAEYLPNITRRSDLNALLGKALGHVSVSGLRIDGGDIPTLPGPGSQIGLLGADYSVDEGRVRIARVLRSGNYNAGSPHYRAPLDQPAVYVSEGDFLLAVNGERIRPERNLYSYFEGTALRPTTVTVASEADGEGSQDFTIVPLPDEKPLRRMNWAEVNRRIVEEESQGILGYVWVPDFSWRGLETVFQQLLENRDKRGLVIDQRFAGGDISADRLIEWLDQAPLYYYTFRHGDNVGVPINALPMNKVLLINDVNASAAETFALMFKLGNLGEVIGTRTLGVGIHPTVSIPELIDGGRIHIPNRAAFDSAGDWAIENQGVQPDIQVDLLPSDWRQGRDPQLQAAINRVLQAIVNNPPLEVTPPEYPVHR